MATRIRREIIADLSKNVGDAVTNIGKLRAQAKAEQILPVETPLDADEEDTSTSLNRPVPQWNITLTESTIEQTRRRMRWVAQISEYWPLDRLASLTPVEMHDILSTAAPPTPGVTQETALGSSLLASAPTLPTRHDLDLTYSPPLLPKGQGRILLVGSGPGHPSLLTVAARAALLEHATLVLSDKLVPSQVSSRIPPRT